MLILTRSELIEITGYQKPKLQREWLHRMGYSFDVNALGRPVVSRAHYESKHAGLAKGKRVGLNLQALDKAG